MKIDFGKTADDYARFRAGFPPEFFDRIAALGLVRMGTAALDLGTGTGTIALGLAARGCAVTALDPSAKMLAQVKARGQEAGLIIRRWEEHLASSAKQPISIAQAQ